MTKGFCASLIKKRIIGKETLELCFKKPSGFDFEPGNHCALTLKINSHTDWRPLSIASAPHESKLKFATRLTNSSFKKKLNQLRAGDKVELSGAGGGFTLHNDWNIPAVFIAGGIGITPFQSMLKHVFFQKLPHQITLFYFNKNPETALYLDELKKQSMNANFSFIPVMTKLENQNSWKGEIGHADVNLFTKYLADITDPIYYIAGPPSMVRAVYSLLNAMNIPDHKIKSEEFSGY